MSLRRRHTVTKRPWALARPWNLMTHHCGACSKAENCKQACVQAQEFGSVVQDSEFVLLSVALWSGCLALCTMTAMKFKSALRQDKLWTTPRLWV